MKHEAIDLYTLVAAMYGKAKLLKTLSYEVPVYQRDQIEIDNLEADIKYMALLIANDKDF